MLRLAGIASRNYRVNAKMDQPVRQQSLAAK